MCIAVLLWEMVVRDLPYRHYNDNMMDIAQAVVVRNPFPYLMHLLPSLVGPAFGCVVAFTGAALSVLLFVLLSAAWSQYPAPQS